MLTKTFDFIKVSIHPLSIRWNFLAIKKDQPSGRHLVLFDYPCEFWEPEITHQGHVCNLAVLKFQYIFSRTISVQMFEIDHDCLLQIPYHIMNVQGIQRAWEKKNACNILGVKWEWIGTCRTNECGWEGNISGNSTEECIDGIDCILLAENRVWQQAVLKRVPNVQISYKVEYSLTVQINMTVFHRVT